MENRGFSMVFHGFPWSPWKDFSWVANRFAEPAHQRMISSNKRNVVVVRYVFSFACELG